MNRTVFASVLAAGVAFVLAACATPPAPPPTEGPTPTTDPLADLPVYEAGDLPYWNDLVFYEIFVRSFYDSDGDGVGDLQGVIERLDYLNDGDPTTTDDLGVTGLWLMPIMESPSYHGYDVVDYFTVDQEYGTNEDFRTLMEAAHERGMIVVVDMVVNHTSREHEWFQQARTPGSEYEDYYIWVEENPAYLGPWGQQVWHPLDGRYYYGVFWSGMPDLNFENPQVTAEMEAISRFWLEEMGVDGFRLDAIKHLIEDGRIQEDTPATVAWFEGYNDFIDSIDPQAFTVGEIWSTSDRVVPYIGTGVDIAFEFNLAEEILTAARRGTANDLVTQQEFVLNTYPLGQYATFLTNHDQDRVVNQLRDQIEPAYVTASILLTSPGVPFIYYGEEIGMVGQKPDERIRTPMQWTPDPETVGFTTGEPWQRLADVIDGRTVAQQTDDPDSLLNHYRALIHLRSETPALQSGDMVLLETGSNFVYAFLRNHPEQTVLVVINLDDEPVSEYGLSGPWAGFNGADLLFGEGEISAPGGGEGYQPLGTLAPRQTLVIELTD